MTIHANRRSALIGGAAFALGLGLCSKVIAANTSLRLAFWGNQGRADRTFSVADLFRKGYPGVDVTGEFLGFNDYWPKLATQVAGGGAPDIVQMDYRFIADYADRGALVALDDYASRLNLDQLDADQVEGGKVGGKVFGVSLGANTAALIINADAFERAGVDVPGQQTTYDDLFALGEAFASKGDRRLIGDGSAADTVLDNWLLQRGKSIYSTDGKLAVDVDDMIAWLSLWDKLRRAGVCVSPEDQALDTGALETTMLVQGKAAMVPSNSNQLVAYQGLLPDDVTISNLPRVTREAKGGHYRRPAMFWSVTSTAQNKELAADFINFFVTDIEAGKLLGVERGVPASGAVRDAIVAGLDDKSKLALNYVANLGPLLGPPPPTPPRAAGEISTSVLRTISQEVAFGARSIEDGAKAFVQNANDVLARS